MDLIVPRVFSVELSPLKRYFLNRLEKSVVANALTHQSARSSMKIVLKHGSNTQIASR